MNSYFVIANITFKEVVRQPLFYVVMFSSVALMFISSSFALFTFGEEGKLVRDLVTATITISGLFVAVFYTASAFADEMKKATAVTILCKPINKAGFIIGRFLGTTFVVLLINVILVVAFAVITSLYSNPDHSGEHSHGFFETVFSTFNSSLVIGVYLAFLKVLILSAISLLLSINFTLVSNVSICFFVYLFGHLNDYFDVYSARTEGFLAWLVKVIFTIIPNLQFFDLGILKRDTLSGGDVSMYILVASLYTVCYCSIMIACTVFSFRKKDVL